MGRGSAKTRKSSRRIDSRLHRAFVSEANRKHIDDDDTLLADFPSFKIFHPFFVLKFESRFRSIRSFVVVLCTFQTCRVRVLDSSLRFDFFVLFHFLPLVFWLCFVFVGTLVFPDCSVKYCEFVWILVLKRFCCSSVWGGFSKPLKRSWSYNSQFECETRSCVLHHSGRKSGCISSPTHFQCSLTSVHFCGIRKS